MGIYVNAHDDQKKTTYYQWDYEEDWEIRSVGFSEYVAIIVYGIGLQILPRDPQEIPLLFMCWKNTRSTNILTFSTAKLSSDIVHRYPLVFIPETSDKLSVRYSILVRQSAISFEAYEYLNLMKRNSELRGSFFDSQPSELIGNIKSISDPDEIAIGYIGIAPVRVARIFINPGQVPDWGFKLGCTEVSIHEDSLAVALQPESIKQFLFHPSGPNLISTFEAGVYAGNASQCLDCRLRGGNNKKPAFW